MRAPTVVVRPKASLDTGLGHVSAYVPQDSTDRQPPCSPDCAPAAGGRAGSKGDTGAPALPQLPGECGHAGGRAPASTHPLQAGCAGGCHAASAGCHAARGHMVEIMVRLRHPNLQMRGHIWHCVYAAPDGCNMAHHKLGLRFVLRNAEHSKRISCPVLNKVDQPFGTLLAELHAHNSGSTHFGPMDWLWWQGPPQSRTPTGSMESAGCDRHGRLRRRE